MSFLFVSLQYGDVFSFTMIGKTFTYLIGSDASALFFNSKNEDLSAEDVYSKLVTPVFGKGVAYDVPHSVRRICIIRQTEIQKSKVYSRSGNFPKHLSTSSQS